MKSIFFSLAALVLAAVPGAQELLPDKIELKDFAQTEAESFDDLTGRAVLLEFFAYWWGPCGKAVPHLNELQSEFGEQGLTIVGVTDEGAKLTEKWIEKHGARYPYAYDMKGGLKGHFGIRGIPHAVLIDPSGRVAWRGHPSALRKSHVEAAVKTALKQPLYAWPKQAGGVAKALKKGKFKAALAAAEKLSLEGFDAVAQVRTLISSYEATAKDLKDKGDHLGARRIHATMARLFKGLPEGEVADLYLEELKADKARMHLLEGQEQLEDLRAEAHRIVSRGKGEKLIEELEELGGEYSGTIVSEQVREVVNLVRSRLARIR